MISAPVHSDVRQSILGDKSNFPPSEVRTLRLSGPSLLSGTLSEEASPLYRTTTKANRTLLQRFDKPITPQATLNPLHDVASICWSASEPNGSSSRWARHLYKDAREEHVTVVLDGQTFKSTEFLKSTSWGR